MRSNSLTLIWKQSWIALGACGAFHLWRNLLPIAAALLLIFPGLTRAGAAEAHLPGEKEATAILQAICPNQIRSEVLKKGAAYGCGGCPSFTGFAGQPPTKGKEPDFELRKVLEGSFTKPGATELLVESFGCEAHVANFGGTLLLEKVGEKWRRVRYASGVVGIVRSYARKDGRDIVLDQGGYTGQGISTGWLSTYVFSAKSDPAEHTLMRVEDSSENACQSDRVSIGYFEKLEFSDLNGDGTPDLRVTVRWGQAKVPAKFQGKCDVEFKPPEAPAYKVDILFDGTAFHVAPGSAATLRKVSAKDQ
jgi:hypothetical protein